MIAVALSGGVDSAVAAIRLKNQRISIMGVTMMFDDNNPHSEQIARAARICRYLGINHHIIDVRREFDRIKKYFCNTYLSGATPNPCAICNRDMKFSLLLDRIADLGVDQVATGHFVRKGFEKGRYYLAKAKEVNSQEYFMGLISQEAIAKSEFPLADLTKADVLEVIKDAGIDGLKSSSSQDVCFIEKGDYGAFIKAYAGYTSLPGVIYDASGHSIGRHMGAIRYTIGQRKGLGMGFGKRKYVLAVNIKENSITIGDREQWVYHGFFVKQINYMKTSGIDDPLRTKVKVRYRQRARSANVKPSPSGDLWVDFDGIYAPGQLAVLYDEDDAILCAGIIEAPSGDLGAKYRTSL